MKYMGSKARLAKDILPIILKDRKPNQWYVEPFAGGMNSLSEVTGLRLASDVNAYLIAMWVELQKGWQPEKITREQYQAIRANKDAYPPHLVGWVGFNCSYSGKWFGGFAGEVETKIGTIRNYQQEAFNNVMTQLGKLKDVSFETYSYTDLDIPKNSIIYCDPPYQNTTKYFTDFDHEGFWTWVRAKTIEGHTVFVSEYAAPPDFETVWEKSVSSSLSANGVTGGNKVSIEKLFVWRP